MKGCVSLISSTRYWLSLMNRKTQNFLLWTFLFGINVHAICAITSHSESLKNTWWQTIISLIVPFQYSLIVRWDDLCVDIFNTPVYFLGLLKRVRKIFLYKYSISENMHIHWIIFTLLNKMGNVYDTNSYSYILYLIKKLFLLSQLVDCW